MHDSEHDSEQVPADVTEAVVDALRELSLNSPPDDRPDVTRPVRGEGPGGLDSCAWCGRGVVDSTHECCVPTIDGAEYCSWCGDVAEDGDHRYCVPTDDGAECSWCGQAHDDDETRHRFCIPTAA